MTWGVGELILRRVQGENWTDVLRQDEDVQDVTQLQIGQTLTGAVDVEASYGVDYGRGARTRGNGRWGRASCRKVSCRLKRSRRG